MKSGHQTTFAVIQENAHVFPRYARYRPLWGVKNKWFFIRVPRKLFGFNISLPYVGTSSEWRWGSSGSRMVLRRCGVANDLTWFEISRKWAAPERCMYIGKSIESIKKCVCTNVLWFLKKNSKCMYNHVSIIFEKSQEVSRTFFSW